VNQRSPTGVIKNIAMLDLTSLRAAEDLAGIVRIENVALLLISESLAGALTRIPTKNVASVVAVPDGARVRTHTGAVVLGGDALADPRNEDDVLVVTGTMALSSPVEKVTYRQLIVTGMVVAPYGSEGPLGAGLTRLTGSVQYYECVEGQRFRTWSGQTKLSGQTLANEQGNPADVLLVTGQTVVTGPVEHVGFQQIVAAGQLLMPRESESVLGPRLSIDGQVVWYDGRPRFFAGKDRFGRGFFDLIEQPLAMGLVGHFSIEHDVTPALLKDKISDIILVGSLEAPKELVPVLQFLVTDKLGTITAMEQGDGDPG
jgi:hypothetical protein